MKATDCKPGEHLWAAIGFDAKEIKVLEPLEPIYQDFVYCEIPQCPPGWKSPRYIRACNLYASKKEVLRDYIAALDHGIKERQCKIKHLNQEIDQRRRQMIDFIKQLEET